MKAIKTIWILLALIGVSCNDELIDNYLRIQFAEYDFTAEEGTLAVNVECTGEWAVISDNEWITVDKNDDGAFTITVEANGSTDERTANVVVESDFESRKMVIRQQGSYFQGKVREFNEVISTIVMSRNGRYTAYTNLDKVPVVEDMVTGEQVAYPDGISGTFTVIAVSDDGATLLLQKSPGNVYMIRQGVLSELPLDEYASSKAVGMSADGSVVVGSVTDSGRMEHPAYWENGTIHLLQTPENDPLGNPLAARNVRLKGCSADGKIIFAADYQSYAYGIIYWKNGELHTPANDMAQIKQIVYKSGRYLYKGARACTVGWNEEMNKSVAISPNGRYLAARFIDYKYINDETASLELSTPACIDLETGEVIVISADIPYSVGMAVDNNGNIFARNLATGDANFKNCIVCNPHDFSFMPVSQFFQKEYGVAINDDRMIFRVGSDDASFFGIKDVTYWYIHL